MPQISKHRKYKRSTVLVKKVQYLRSLTSKSYKPLCKKLKINNSTLAKALSKEKQECQSLFSENVGLIAKVQDLNLACKKREDVISYVSQNAREILKMLVAMTGYITNTITCCQEFATTSDINLHKSHGSSGRRESSRRLSTKSPAKGVVKPMVSGHTITKPTINISRVNMQQRNNPSDLSIIEEVPTTPPNQDLNNSTSRIVVPIRQHRYEVSRVCRMPERLTAASTRISEENERRLSKRSSRPSGRMSEKFSRPRSGRLSGSIGTRKSMEYIEHMRSPRVKLNDVSKLLQNSQSINIRMLEGNQQENINESSENSDDSNQKDVRSDVTVPKIPAIDESEGDSDKTVSYAEETVANESLKVNDQARESKNKTSKTTSWDDPLEGPSWLFNNSETVPCLESNPDENDHTNTSNDDNTSMFDDSNQTTLNSTLDNAQYGEDDLQVPALNKNGNHSYNSTKNSTISDKSNGTTSFQENENNNSLSNIPPVSVPPCSNVDNATRRGKNGTVNLVNFITQRRGYFDNAEEDVDDFTLMYNPSQRNMNFDMNDLRLPVLEEPALKPLVVNEPEPELTTNVQKIIQTCPIPSVSNDSLNHSAFDQSTVNLPLLVNNDYDRESSPMKSKQSKAAKQRRNNRITFVSSPEYLDRSSVFNKENEKQKKISISNKDPSSAKVVLEKLDESDVKQRSLSPEEMSYRRSRSYMSPVTSRLNNNSDSESNTSSSSTCNVNRPRRKRAPTNLQEPNLKKKLRRNR